MGTLPAHRHHWRRETTATYPRRAGRQSGPAMALDAPSANCPRAACRGTTAAAAARGVSGRLGGPGDRHGPDGETGSDRSSPPAWTWLSTMSHSSRRSPSTVTPDPAARSLVLTGDVVGAGSDGERDLSPGGRERRPAGFCARSALRRTQRAGRRSLRALGRQTDDRQQAQARAHVPRPRASGADGSSGSRAEVAAERGGLVASSRGCLGVRWAESLGLRRRTPAR